MIRFAVIHRAKDGLALSASTDVDSGVELRDSKRYAKLLSKKSRQFPVRSIMHVGRFNVCFTTEADVCFLMICETTFATVLAYSFLDDLKKEFLGQYTRGAVEKAIRPYSFIEFDAHIQKAKQRYNSTRTLNTRINLSDLNEELKNNPPYEITESELGMITSMDGGTKAYKATTIGTSRSKLSPLSWFASISLLLSALCALLNLIRIVPYLSHHDEDEVPWKTISLAFFLSSIANLLQCYALLHPLRFRQLLSWICAVTSLFFLYYLNDLRDNSQVTFHLVATICITFYIWKRTLQGKLPNYDV